MGKKKKKDMEKLLRLIEMFIISVWWLCGCTLMSKCILYIFNMCSLLCINYSLIKMLKTKK